MTVTLTSWLLEVMEENDVLWRLQVLRHGGDVTARKPVCAEDGVVADVRPEHPLLRAQK